MTLPDDIRSELRSRLWELADQMDWMNLSATEKARQYEDWTRQSEIGGVLARFMDTGKIRVYLKDSLLKGYSHARLSSLERPFRVAGIEDDARIVESYTKPLGCRLRDGRIVCWGRAEDWKTILMALHERSYVQRESQPFAAVLMFADGRFREAETRNMIDAAAMKLGIKRLIWLDL